MCTVAMLLLIVRFGKHVCMMSVYMPGRQREDGDFDGPLMVVMVAGSLDDRCEQSIEVGTATYL